MIYHHILIGAPSSGKSTLARHLKQQMSDSHIVATDDVRASLYGDSAIQGSWTEIAAEVQHQCQQALATGQTIIYDATNAQRPWRMEFLELIAQYQPDLKWIGWYLNPSLSICERWNRSRERKVSQEVLHRLYQSLQDVTPDEAEGMELVETIDLSQIANLEGEIRQRLKKIPRRITNRRNRTLNSSQEFHPYSSLLAFERLLYLMQLLIEHPGAGGFYRHAPDSLQKLLGQKANLATLQNEIDELSALLSDRHHPLYGEPTAISYNLQWLKNNHFLSPNPTNEALYLPPQKAPTTPTHPYSDREAFLRLMGTIREIAHHPFPCLKGVALESLTLVLQERGIIYGSMKSGIAIVRKDIERILKPYRLLPESRHKKGYFLGTGIFSQIQLIQLHQLISGLAKTLQDPIGLELLETLSDRLQISRHSPLKPYPVRTIYNHTIVSRERLPHQTLAHDIEKLEQEIETGKCLELGRFQGVGTFGTEPDDFCEVWPVQIVFQNIAWYLGYEIATGEQRGLLQFERIDRLFRGRETSGNRERSAQEKACKYLRQLYEASGGLYLGDNATHQQQWLAGEREAISVKLELWFSDRSYRFVCEGDLRFPRGQLGLSPPFNPISGELSGLYSLEPTGDPYYPHRLEVILPNWAWRNIDLQRWILGFGVEVKLISPMNWAMELKETLGQMAAIYTDQ